MCWRGEQAGEFVARVGVVRVMVGVAQKEAVGIVKRLIKTGLLRILPRRPIWQERHTKKTRRRNHKRCQQGLTRAAGGGLWEDPGSESAPQIIDSESKVINKNRVQPGLSYWITHSFSSATRPRARKCQCGSGGFKLEGRLNNWSAPAPRKDAQKKSDPILIHQPTPVFRALSSFVRAAERQ